MEAAPRSKLVSFEGGSRAEKPPPPYPPSSLSPEADRIKRISDALSSCPSHPSKSSRPSRPNLPKKVKLLSASSGELIGGSSPSKTSLTEVELPPVSDSFKLTNNPIHRGSDEAGNRPYHPPTTNHPDHVAKVITYPRMSRFWVYLLLLGQAGSLLLTIRALSKDSKLFGVTPSCTSLEGCHEAKWAGQAFFQCEAVWPLHLLAYVVIFMYHPTRKRVVGPLQVVSMVLGMASRGLFVFRDSGKALFDVGGPLIATVSVAILTNQRCKRIKAEFSPEQVHELVYKVLPRAVLSVLPNLIFLLGESCACLEEKIHETWYFLAGADSWELAEPSCEDSATLHYCSVGCSGGNNICQVSLPPPLFTHVCGHLLFAPRAPLFTHVCIPPLRHMRIANSRPSPPPVRRRCLQQQRHGVRVLVRCSRPSLHHALPSKTVHDGRLGVVRPRLRRAGAGDHAGCGHVLRGLQLRFRAG